MIHLYALTGAAPTALAVAGLGAAPISSLACGRLHAVVSEHTDAPTASRDSALRHAAVVAAVAEQGPTLPARFGIRHPDAATLQTAVVEREGRLLATLGRIGDAVEFVVRAVPSPRVPASSRLPEGADAGRGRAYLEDRLTVQHAARDARDVAVAHLEAVTTSLVDLGRGVVDRDGHAGPERCFLVDREVADRFAAAATTAIADRDDLVLGGPWPPYSFVDTEVAT